MQLKQMGFLVNKIIELQVSINIVQYYYYRLWLQNHTVLSYSFKIIQRTSQLFCRFCFQFYQYDLSERKLHRYCIFKLYSIASKNEPSGDVFTILCTHGCGTGADDKVRRLSITERTGITWGSDSDRRLCLRAQKHFIFRWNILQSHKQDKIQKL